MATIRKRGNGWRAEVYRNGRRRSKTFHTKAQAQSWALQVEVELDDLQMGRIPADKSVRDLLQRYLREVSPGKRGERWERLRLEALCRDDPLATVPLRELSAQTISSWRDRRLRQVSPATVLREWNLLSNAFNIGLREWGWVAENPMTRVRKPATPAARDRRLTQDEIDQLVMVSGYTDKKPPTTLTARVGATMLFAIETAMRAGEIASLTWAHVHAERRYVHLPMTKNGKPRDVPLSRRALDLIERMKPLTGEHESNIVFGLSPRQIDALFRKIKKKTSIEDLHFHDTRREALSRLAMKFDVMDLAKISGHRDLRILQNVYYAPKVDDLVSRLD
ncbi:hypothetical protein BI364_06775 [Acidihalobacter yilgarnensis]|uniref:Tyr recombinase domain-containing protein n=1 Tax=Acidihalobacter yilgarnensis TaxID=2819280 RepID=A0A1D8IMK4_9GAMM|nr:site-specific integrase [Acidihalobacter yilgarnensis]AOU97702.1 hypothetical protein BI364_06775 [Acidihalobacter yilgarnensis]